MPRSRSVGEEHVAAWRTTNRATEFLVESLPAAIWDSPVPGVPRRTVRRIAAHLHNCRCSWIKALGARHGVRVPRRVEPDRVRQPDLVRALGRSSDGMVRLIELGSSRGGRVPPATWQNFPTDLEHFLAYFAAHEAHHRGQLILIARQLGHRLASRVADGVWQWKARAREASTR
jgi:uncharacterized damage-inducible protein DinB